MYYQPSILGGIGGSGGQPPGVPGGIGSVGTPTYIPQNDPHDHFKIHKWGKFLWVGFKMFFCSFHPFLNFP